MARNTHGMNLQGKFLTLEYMNNIRTLLYHFRFKPTSFSKFLIIFFIFFFFLSDVLAVDVPDHGGYVNDYGEMISLKTRGLLEAQLRNFEKSDLSEIVILTVLSLEGEIIDNFSIKVARSWGIGQHNEDRGILITVARQDRKIRIEVGKGLERRVMDLMAGRILNEVIIPKFKKGDFDGGFNAGVSALIDAIRGIIPQKKRPQIM